MYVTVVDASIFSLNSVRSKATPTSLAATASVDGASKKAKGHFLLLTVEQVESANIVLWNKTDLVTAEEQERTSFARLTSSYFSTRAGSK